MFGGGVVHDEHAITGSIRYSSSIRLILEFSDFASYPMEYEVFCRTATLRVYIRLSVIRCSAIASQKL